VVLFKSCHHVQCPQAKHTQSTLIIDRNTLFSGYIYNYWGVFSEKNSFDIDEYDEKGYNKEGINCLGYNTQGYDIGGYNKNGFDKTGYNKQSINKCGCDRDGLTDEIRCLYHNNDVPIWVTMINKNILCEY